MHLSEGNTWDIINTNTLPASSSNMCEEKKTKQQEDIFFLVKNSMCSKQPLHTIQFNNLVGKRISAEGKIKNKQIKRNLTIFASWLEVKAQTIWTHVTAYNSQSKIT